MALALAAGLAAPLLACADSKPDDLAQLRARQLTIPVQSVAAAQLADTYSQERGGGERAHQALDIMAPRGTPVLAATDGTVEKLFESVPGGLTIYQFDRDRTHAYYYAHLDRYAPGLAEKQAVKRGDVLGYVGYTGNANPQAPHLHFAIFRLGPEKKWWKGTPINPYPYLHKQ
jgi:peptidoglycan LD-endopeptidase LytH